MGGFSPVALQSYSPQFTTGIKTNNWTPYTTAFPTGNPNDLQTEDNNAMIQQGNRAYQDALQHYQYQMQYGAMNNWKDSSGNPIPRPTAPGPASSYYPTATNLATLANPAQASALGWNNMTVKPYQYQAPSAAPGATSGGTAAAGGPAPFTQHASTITSQTSTAPPAPGGTSGGGLLLPNSQGGGLNLGAPATSTTIGSGPYANLPGHSGTLPLGTSLSGPAPFTPTSTTQPTASSTGTPASAPSFVPASLSVAHPSVGGAIPSAATTSQAPSGPSATDLMMAANAGNMGYLQNIAGGGGAGQAVTATPAWQAMIAAQNQQNQANYNNMMAGFGASGNRDSTDFGTSAQMFWNQTGLNQNSLLAQMQMQAQQAANANQLSASGQLGGFAQQDLSQLSGQNFQALMQQMQQQFGAATTQYGAQAQAGLLAPQLNLQTSQDLMNAYLQNMQAGTQIGQQQYTTQEDAINRAIQSYYQSQPQYNPTLPYQYSSSFQNPQLFYPQYKPSQLGQILGGVGALAGAAPGLINLIQQAINASHGGGSINSGPPGAQFPGGLPGIDIGYPGGYPGSDPTTQFLLNLFGG